MRYIYLIISSMFFLETYGQTKYYTPKIKVNDSIEDSLLLAKEAPNKFRVISKIKQVDLKDVGKKIKGGNQCISINGGMLKFSNKKKAFKISDQLYETEDGDCYYSFNYYDRRLYYATVLFNKNDEIIIVITDDKGAGWMYCVEII